MCEASDCVCVTRASEMLTKRATDDVESASLGSVQGEVVVGVNASRKKIGEKNQINK